MPKSTVDYYQQNSDKFKWGIKHLTPQYKLDEILPLIQGQKILDVGCGPGHLVHLLSLKGFQVNGVDNLSQFINFAQKKYHGNFLMVDAQKLPFKKQQFDTVILKSVLEHLDNDLIALKEALRVGKRVIVIVPQSTPQNLINKGLIYSHYQDKTHLRTYTKITLKRLIKKSGGELIEIKQIEKLPIKSVVFELLKGSALFKKVFIKLIFLLFKEPQYYLELLAIIKSC